MIINSKSIAKDFGAQLGIPTTLDNDQTGPGQYFEKSYFDWTKIGGQELFKMDCE